MATKVDLPLQTKPAAEKTNDRQHQSVGETLAKSVVRSIGSQVDRQITRGVLGGLFGGSRRR